VKRVNEDFIDQYVKETEELSSPEIFRRWAAIAAVAGALERKVWTRSRNMDLYPNLYTILVGPPGVGKTVRLILCGYFGGGLKVFMSPGRTYLELRLPISWLAQIERSCAQTHSGTVSFNSLLVASNELQVFLSAYESDFIGLLTDLYDCKWFSEEKRTKDLQIDIDHPQLNILAATTPSYLNELFADKAWDQGFSSRTSSSIQERSSVVRYLLRKLKNRTADFHMTLEPLINCSESIYGRRTQRMLGGRGIMLEDRQYLTTQASPLHSPPSRSASQALHGSCCKLLEPPRITPQFSRALGLVT
jgi:hypothetical protein